MKNLVFMLLAMATVSISTNAHADPQESYRYKASYRDWNRGFYNYYGYREQVCDNTLTSYGSIETCYNLRPNDTVWVWERRNGGYRYITVYKDSGYNQSVAHYWVSDDGYNRRVVRRRYNNSYYYYGPTYERCYDSYYGYVDCYDPYIANVTINVDFSTAEGKIVTGAYVALIGVDIIANADSDEELLVGAISASLGSASAAKGFEQLEEESKLAKSVHEAKVANDLENNDIK